MFVRLLKQSLFQQEKKSAKDRAAKNLDANAPSDDADFTKPKLGWEEVLTQSLKENALAPSDEVILHAYNLYCDELNEPFAKRRRAMNERFSNVIAEFAALQALAPDMIERAAAKHRLELDRFLEKKGYKS